MMARQPRWAEALLSLRNLLVAPLGLRTSGAGLVPPRDMIGIFPVVSETPDRLIAGFSDRHLGFRVVVDVTAPGGVEQVTATTLVKTHNWLGRTYLAIIMPFHRLICPPCCVRRQAEALAGRSVSAPGRPARYSDPLLSR